MNLDFSNIGKRIQKTRMQNKITQKQMAEYLGISMHYISKLENGKTNIELEKFMKICDFLNISIYDVLNEKNENIIRYMDKELYELIIRCSLEKQRLIYHMVKLMFKNQIV